MPQEVLLPDFCLVKTKENEQAGTVTVSLLKRDSLHLNSGYAVLAEETFSSDKEEDALKFAVEAREKATLANRLLKQMVLHPEKISLDNTVQKEIEFRGFAQRVSGAAKI